MERRDQASAGGARQTPIIGYRAAPLVLILLLLSVAAPAARADFGIAEANISFAEANGLAASLAGSRPATWTTSLALNAVAPGEPESAIRTLRVQLPPGLIGALALLPTCSHAAFDAGACPPATEIGSLEAIIAGLGLTEAPIYALSPSPGAAGELGIAAAAGYVGFVQLTIAGAAPYNVIATFANIPLAFSAATMTIDAARPNGSFLVMPRACSGPLAVRFEAQSAQRPGLWATATATTRDNAVVPNPIGLSECARLAYSPILSISPTADRAASPTGLRIDFDAPDPGLASPTGFAHADTAAATFIFPKGMTVNPPVAAGLSACRPADLAREGPESPPGIGCPPEAKLGSAALTTPLLAQAIPGTIYAAQPDDPATAEAGAENPFDSLFALYVVFKDPERGILLSLPIRLNTSPETGRLTAVFDQIPQLPLDHLELRFNAGLHAPLTTPAACGSHQIAFTLTPSSGNTPLQGSDPFTTAAADCNPPFAPTLSAGTSSNAAGRSASFILDLTNPDAAPDLSALSLTLPPGLSAAFASVPTCPEADAGTGGCPPASRLGYARIAVGTGPEPLWIPETGKDPSAVYLAGPYRGAPYSVLIVVPAQAGPFDLGTVITRAAIQIDPASARATVAIASLPQVLAGVPLHYRQVRLILDRPGFIHNPTSCEPTRITAIATATATAAAGAELSDRFQAADCAALGLRPRLSLGLSGGIGRDAHPTLSVDVDPRPGDANLRAASLSLPYGLFIDPTRLRSACPLRRFADHSCPPSTRLGWVQVMGPLLPDPERGRLFMVQGAGRLPDIAASLGGDVPLDLQGHLTSRHTRIRASFDSLPDIPLSHLHMVLKGGFRGLLVNSDGLCSRRPPLLGASFVGHNDKRRQIRPRATVRCPR